ncbi:kinase-like domain-containing protein [Favolaschia claudopus]|uniref:Kinase-like domain-containing protein n=1 Tax=Favolaschia claudopus TaxID=2862362 RepID=A0AAV9ZDB8_9AGAR
MPQERKMIRELRLLSSAYTTTGIPPPEEEDDKGSSGEEIFFGHYTLPEIPGRDLKGRITQDDQYPFAGGGNCNVYRGKLTRSDGRKIRVAIKMFRPSDGGSGQLDDIVRRLKREVEVWSKLKHKNILPFIGVCDDLAPTPVLISPFYKFGHVGTYLSKHPHMNRTDIVNGVACGLQFLHDNEVVHGDLKLHNILVDKRGTPCICDFGISKIVNRHGFTTASVGTIPYMAPELFLVIDRDGVEAKPPTTTQKTDIYSFGLLVLEIMTSRPLEERPSRPIITLKALENLRPKRIQYTTETISDEIWQVLEQCWAFEAKIRPSIHEIMLSALCSSIKDSPNIQNSSGHKLRQTLSLDALQVSPLDPVAFSNTSTDSIPSRVESHTSLDPTSTQQANTVDSKHIRLPPVHWRSSGLPLSEFFARYSLNDPTRRSPILSPPSSPTRLQPRYFSPLPTVSQFNFSGNIPKLRKGFWNRRGDHLTEDGFVVYAPLNTTYPSELHNYPDETVGYRDHLGKEVPWSASHVELPESLPRFGQLPLRPYEQFIVYHEFE